MIAERFGDTLKRLRAKKGVTQFELARKTGMSETAIAYLERNEREPLFKTAIYIADALGVSVNEFHVVRKVTGQRETKR